MKMRVVNVGDKRNINRLLRVVAVAIDETCPDLPAEGRHRLLLAIVEAAHNEGLVLTGQVSQETT